MDEQRPEQSERGGVIGWIARHPKMVAAVCLLLLIVVVLFALDARAERGLARRIAAIKAKGEPTTVQDLLARQRQIPDDQNMLVAVLKCATQLPTVKPDDERVAKLPYIGLAQTRSTGERWSEAELDAASLYLVQASGTLAKLHESMAIPDSVYNITWKTPGVAVLLPELSVIRQASKTLALEALTAANRAEREKAEKCVLGMLPLTHALEGGDFVNR